MKKQKIISIQAITITLMLVIQMIIPILSLAEGITLSVELKRDEVDTNRINIIATDTTYDIVELKYVKKEITTDNINYFKENNSDVITLEIEQSHEVNSYFQLDGAGTYTVYAKNSHGDQFLSRITINESNNVTINIEKDQENPYKIKINVQSEKYNISKLKVAKKDNYNDDIDFSKQGTDIEFVTGKIIDTNYTVQEDGIYTIYAEDEMGNNASRTIILSQEFPINIEIEELGNKQIRINATDTFTNIVKIKVAKKSEITSFDDFKDKGTELEITPSKNVTATYTATDEDTYKIYVEDEFGNRKMTEKRITLGNVMSIEVTQDEQKPYMVFIKATNTISNITSMKIAIGDDLTADYIKENGEELIKIPTKTIELLHVFTENCTINIYVEDEDGYKYIYKKTIIVKGEEDTEPPTIELIQNGSTINVTVQDKDSYIKTIKMEEGSRDIDYFTTNGTQIGVGSLGKVIETSFNAKEGETYTVYAEDEAGNKAIKSIVIELGPPIAIEDTEPPIIEGVTNEGIYNESVTPIITDENEYNVILNKDGNEIEYDGKTSITEEGVYKLTATDVLHNQSIVNFTIDKTAPEITINTSAPVNNEVIISIVAKDNLTSIVKIKVASGSQNIDYFSNNGQELNPQIVGSTGTVTVKTTKNGTYTIYAEDTAGNKAIKEIIINSIKDLEPTPEPDTTAPKIEGVKNGEVYKSSVTPIVKDENLVEVILIKDGNKVDEYKNNQTITEEGKYVLTATDKAGNTTKVSFEIKYDKQEPGNNTTGNDTANNNTTGNNTFSNNNSNNVTNSDDSLSNKPLPKTGIRELIIVPTIIALTIIAAVSIYKYKKIN